MALKCHKTCYNKGKIADKIRTQQVPTIPAIPTPYNNNNDSIMNNQKNGKGVVTEADIERLLKAWNTGLFQKS